MSKRFADNPKGLIRAAPYGKGRHARGSDGGLIFPGKEKLEPLKLAL